MREGIAFIALGVIALAVAGASASCAQNSPGLDAGGVDAGDASLDVAPDAHAEAAAACAFPEGGAPGTVDDGFAYQTIPGSYLPLAMVADSQRSLYVAGIDQIGQTGACWISTTVEAINVVKVLSNGAVDTTFGTSGHLCIALPNDSQQLNALAFDSTNDTIVGIGTQAPGTGVAVLVVKFDTTGKLVKSFGSNGVLTLTNANKQLWAGTGVALDTSYSPPKIVLVGNGWIARLENDGTLDPSFNGGAPLVDITYAYSALSVTPDGYYVTANTGASSAILRRVTRGGTFDLSFKGGAAVPIALISQYVTVWDIELLSNNRVALAAWVDKSPTSLNLVAYDNAGNQDVAFGTVRPRIDGGVLGPWVGSVTSTRIMYRDCEGRLVVTGTIAEQNAVFAGIARVLDDGGLDTQFGDHGIATVGLDGGTSGEVSIEDPITGRIVAALAGPSGQLVLVRLFR